MSVSVRHEMQPNSFLSYTYNALLNKDNIISASCVDTVKKL